MTSMTTFVKVVQAGGFAAASRKLKISPSTATAHIHTLEERLGVRLLNRTTRKVSLTEVGKAYYDRCLQILDELDDADNVAQSLQSTPRGRLHVNGSISIPRLFAPVIAEFTGLYPKVTVSLITSDRMVDLVEEGFDLAIRTGPIPESSLIIRRHGSYGMMVCGSSAYFADRGVTRDPAELADHNCLTFSFSALGSKWRIDGPDGPQAIAVSGNMESNNIDVLRLAAIHGQGLIVMPSFLVVDDINAGRLMPVLTDFFRIERPVNAIYPHRHHLSAKVRTFLDLAAQHCRRSHQAFGSVVEDAVA